MSFITDFKATLNPAKLGNMQDLLGDGAGGLTSTDPASLAPKFITGASKTMLSKQVALQGGIGSMKSQLPQFPMPQGRIDGLPTADLTALQSQANVTTQNAVDLNSDLSTFITANPGSELDPDILRLQSTLNESQTVFPGAVGNSLPVDRTAAVNAQAQKVTDANTAVADATYLEPIFA